MMKYFFWVLSVVSIGVIAYVQLIHDSEPLPEPAMLATGMPPQIDLITEIASDNGWKISCTGNAGDLTVVRLVPKFFWFLASSQDGLREELSLVATEIQSDDRKREGDEIPCDLPANNNGISLDAASERNFVGFGTREHLQTYMKIAEECEVRGAQLAPVTAEEQETLTGPLPDDWVGLIIDGTVESRTGPVTCLVFLASRMERAANIQE